MTMGYRVIGVLLWAMLWPMRVEACDCGILPVCHATWTSDGVFVGTVYQNDATGAHFVVEEWLRGQGPGTRIHIELTERGVGCNYSFTEGQRYVVFAKKNAGGQWGATLCGGSAPFNQGQEALKYIRDALARPGPGSMFGDGFIDIDPGEFMRSGGPLANLRVALTSTNARLTAVTDAKGMYRFSSVPPGDYTFTVETPAELTPIPSTAISIGRDACLNHVFVTTKR